MHTKLTFGILALAVLAPVSGRSQDARVSGNARVRVTAPSVPHGRVVGRLLSEDAGTLRLATDDAIFDVPRDAVTKLEISRRRGRRGRGALIGTLAGAVAGGVLGASSHQPCDESQANFLIGGCLFTKQDETVMGAILFAPVGAVLGALVGRGERWETVPATRVRLSVAPAFGRGVGARVALSF